MTSSRGRSTVNWRQAWGQALLIFLGVGVALLGQAWWEHRADRALEQYLLEEIRGGLSLDSADIASAMSAAEARLVGADRLLVHVVDPDAGVLHPTPWEVDRSGQIPLRKAQSLERALAAYASTTVSPRQALYMVVATSSMQRLDLADATFTDAASSGQLNVIQDSELRTLIADYYFNTGRFGETTDGRVDTHWQSFRRVLADTGLSAAGGETSERVLAVLADNPTLLAEVKNVRDYAAYQLGALEEVLLRAVALITSLDLNIEK